jgi:hypothetical protein
MIPSESFRDETPWDIASDAEGDDKLREECGVFGVIGASDASAVCALGLHALQHRGQEAAGISAYDGKEFVTRRGLGHVADNFSSEEAIAELPGHMAVGHVRYSTTGGAGLRNVQPLYADLASGGFAVAHNGNISNAGHLRSELVEKGAIFQSTSDTGVKQAGLLEHVAQGTLVHGQENCAVLPGLAIDAHAGARHPFQPGDGPQQAGLAAAGRAEQSGDTTPGQIEVDAQGEVFALPVELHLQTQAGHILGGCRRV